MLVGSNNFQCYSNYAYFVIDLEVGWTVAKLRKKRRQLKINWALALLITMLEGVSYTSITTSFHQFVTNPRSESLGNHSNVGLYERYS